MEIIFDEVTEQKEIFYIKLFITKHEKVYTELLINAFVNIFCQGMLMYSVVSTINSLTMF